MKKLFIVAILTLFTTTSFAGNNDLSIVKGTWDRKNAQIKLYTVENGVLKQLSSYNPSADGKFYFAFSPEKEGFFVIGINDISRQNNFTFYFKPGDQLNFAIKEGNYTLVGQNTPENQEMARWHESIMYPLEAKFFEVRSTYEDFFPLLEQKAAEANAFKQKYTKNATFNRNFQNFRDLDLKQVALSFLSMPHPAHPKAEDFTPYYATIDLKDMAKDEAMLNYPYGSNIITTYSIMAPSFAGNKFSEQQKEDLRKPFDALDVLLPEIGNDVLKGETVLSRSKYLKTYEGYLDFSDKYSKYLVTENQQLQLKNLLKTVPENKPQDTAINFTFEDIDGKKVSLTDFKGKVVYIDVWATWCRPCLGEIPSLKKLEEEYHDQNIVFMSVSTDKSADRQKWKNMVMEKELKGVQLTTGDAKAEILDPYKITGIPRFILVDKNGKLISSDAPRPSSSEIRPVLNAALKK